MPTYNQIAECVRRLTGRTVRRLLDSGGEAQVGPDDEDCMEPRSGDRSVRHVRLITRKRFGIACSTPEPRPLGEIPKWKPCASGPIPKAVPARTASRLPLGGVIVGWASGGESCSGGACPSLVAYLTIRDNRRRSRSSASGPGLEKTRTTPISGVSPASLRFLFCPFLSLSFISLRRASPSRASVLSPVVR